MSQQVAISTVLRAIPNALLQVWVKHHPRGEDPVSWNKIGEREIEPILNYLDSLPREQHDAMEIELHRVRSFANETGMAAINDAAKRHGIEDLMTRVPEELDLNGRAMWVRLNEPEIFAESSTYLQLDQCSFWRKRNDVPAGIEILPDAKDKLSLGISTLLREDGRGKYTTTEVVKRNEMTYFIAHPDDYVRSENTHDQDGNLMSIALRPTSQVIYVYDASVGSSQIATGIKQPRKSQLEKVCALAVLGWTLGDYEPDQAYQLEHLKDSTFVLATDPVDNIRARIETLWMNNTNTGRPVSVGVNRKNINDTIHQAIDDELGTDSDSLWHLQVRSVEMKFYFPASRFQRASNLTIKISPRTCNLARLTSDRAEIVQKHLKMWEIDCATGEQSAVAAVGT